MIAISLFTLSGVILAVIMIAKRMEERKKTGVFILKAISRGDALVREFHHQAVHLYSTGKEKAVFFVKKQVPMHSKISLIKVLNILKDRTERHIGNIRDSRLLKKSDGISEFFKNMNEVEKGAGEINESYFEEGKIDIEPIIESIPVVEEVLEIPKPKTVRKRTYTPRKKKVSVSIVEPE